LKPIQPEELIKEIEGMKKIAVPNEYKFDLGYVTALNDVITKIKEMGKE